MKRFLRWLDYVRILNEQIDELHGRVRILEAQLGATTNERDDYKTRMFEAHEDLLEHSHGACAIARGEYHQ